jgi:hypothetical protein
MPTPTFVTFLDSKSSRSLVGKPGFINVSEFENAGGFRDDM